MATQPLSREDSIYIPSDLPIELQIVSPNIRKTTARKASRKTATTTCRASTAKSKTVAKTATTHRRSVTKSVPIEDFSTSDNLVRSSLIHADDRRLHTPNLDATPNAPSQAHGILSQLQICRQSLMALQSQSAELHHRMAALTAIAQQMDELEPLEIVEPTATAAIPVTPTRPKSELCLPTLNPSSIAATSEIPAAPVGRTAAPSAVSPSAIQTPAVKPSFQSTGNRSGISSFPVHRVSQHVEYYVGPLVADPDPRPIAKPSQLMRSKQPASQIVHKPISQFVPKAPKAAIKVAPKSSIQSIRNPVAIAFADSAGPIVPTAGSLLQQLIPIPKGEGAILLDAFCWTISAIGVRMSCHLLTQLVPLLTLPLTIVLLGPALIATYLAFCVPKSSSAAVYRCLLVTLGFFIGGKF